MDPREARPHEPLVAVPGMLIAPFDRNGRRVGRWKAVGLNLEVTWNPGELNTTIDQIAVWDGDGQECWPLTVGNCVFPTTITPSSSFTVILHPPTPRDEYRLWHDDDEDEWSSE